jgi:hypothetical protein
VPPSHEMTAHDKASAGRLEIIALDGIPEI